jgi:hypothetical protein
MWRAADVPIAPRRCRCAPRCVGVTRDGEAVVLRVARSGANATFTVLVPDDGGGSVRRHRRPVASPVIAIGNVPTLALRVTVPAGSTARLERGASPRDRFWLTATDDEPDAGERVTFRPRPAARSCASRQVDEDETRIGDTIDHAFASPGTTVHALAIAADGSARRRHLNSGEARSTGICSAEGRTDTPYLGRSLLLLGFAGTMRTRTRE